jgi:hypothetical protein
MASERIAAVRGEFDEVVEELLSGDHERVSTRRVDLPGGGRADVALKVVSHFGRRLEALGFARYDDGRLAGEQHIEEVTPSFNWMESHKHADLACAGFVYEDGLFRPSEAGRNMVTRPEFSEEERAFALGVTVVAAMMGSGYGYDVFQNEASSEHARRLHSVGRLFFDSALHQALEERLAEPEVS